MKITRLLAVLLAATALTVGSFATAGPVTIRLFDGITTVTVADGDVGPPTDSNAVAGAVTWIGGVGSWVVNVTTGVGAPLFSDPHLDLNSINISNTSGPGVFLDVWVSQTDFTLGGIAQLAAFFGSIGGTSVGTLAWDMWVDDANGLFSQATQVAGAATVGSPFAQSGVGHAIVDGTFSMTLHVRVLHGNAPGTTSFDFEGFVVPEPGTIALLGIGLIGLALLRRRA